jgi:hypothetical protein
MTELYAKNLRGRILEIATVFDSAKLSADFKTAHAAWLKLLTIADTAISEARGARIEAESLATELLTYRLTRLGEPAAPRLKDYAYVHTSNFPWVCAAKWRRKTIRLDVGFCSPQEQEFYVPEQKTVCGKSKTFEVRDRFGTGGWPRFHELCPDCVRGLVERDLIAVGESGNASEAGPLPKAPWEDKS